LPSRHYVAIDELFFATFAMLRVRQRMEAINDASAPRHASMFKCYAMLSYMRALFRCGVPAAAYSA